MSDHLKSFKAKIKNREHPHYGEWGEARFYFSGCADDHNKIILDDGEEIEMTEYDIRRSFLDNSDGDGIMTLCIGRVAIRVKDFTEWKERPVGRRPRGVVLDPSYQRNLLA